MHINLGHPTAEELVRLACHQGNPSIHTSSRPFASSNMRPATVSNHHRHHYLRLPLLRSVTQFGDRVELDILHARKLDGENVMVPGMVDVATRFHQAAVLSGRAPKIACEAFERVWLRPYGLPTVVAADPDGCFQSDFQHRLESRGTLVEHCPPDAYWKIAHVERQNAFLRTDGFAHRSIAPCGEQCSAQQRHACGGEGAFGGCEGDSRSECATVHRYPSNPRFGARESMLEMETAKTEKEGWLGDSQVPFLGPLGTDQTGMGEVRNNYSFVLPLASNSGCLASRT